MYTLYEHPSTHPVTITYNLTLNIGHGACDYCLGKCFCYQGYGMWNDTVVKVISSTSCLPLPPISLHNLTHLISYPIIWFYVK